LSVFLNALALLNGATVHSFAQTPPTAATNNPPYIAIARKISIEGLPNFGEVTPTLYRGAQPTRLGLRKLKEMGFDIVVDFRVDHDKEKDLVTSLGMEYVAIPWSCVHPEDEDIAMFLSLLRSHPGKKIFVHCRDGIDRTGMEIAAFRIVEQGWSEKDARKEMQAFGFSRLHRTVCAPLVPYEANFNSRFQRRHAFEALRGRPSSGTGSPAK